MSFCREGQAKGNALHLLQRLVLTPSCCGVSVRAPSCGKLVGRAFCCSSLCRRHGELPWVLP